MRDDAGPTILALAGAVVLIVTFGAIAVVVALSGTPSGSTGDLRSYYFRAVIEVDLPDDDDVLGTVEGWYDGPGRWRWSFGDGEQIEAGSLFVADGETVVYYDRETNVYYRQPMAGYNEGRAPELTEGPPTLPASFLIGWLPYGDADRFFEAWQDGERETQAGGELAGRSTELTTLSRQGSTTGFWIDREFPFVLKYETRSTTGPQQFVRVEIVELALNEPVNAEVFAFQPPPGSLEVEPPGSSVSSSGSSSSSLDGSVAAPEGFYAPQYVPSGYVVSREEGGHAGALGGRQSRFLVRLENGDAYIEIDEQFRAGGLAESQKTGEPASVSGEPAYLQVAGDVTRLVWSDGDIVIAISSNALDMEELARIAESMR